MESGKHGKIANALIPSFKHASISFKSKSRETVQEIWTNQNICNTEEQRRRKDKELHTLPNNGTKEKESTILTF